MKTIETAITIKQPWASLIVEGIKDIENRTWKCPKRHIGKRVLIHAGLDNLLDKFNGYTSHIMTREQERCIVRYSNESELKIFGTHLPVGAIIGSVEIAGCTFNHPSVWAEKSKGVAPGGHVLDEYEPIIWNWVLANPIMFKEPILNVKGMLGFWYYTHEIKQNEVLPSK